MMTMVSFLVRYLVVGLMFAVGLRSRPADLIHIRENPWLYLRSVLVIVFGVPLLAVAVVALFGLPRIPAGILLLMAASPGAPFIAKSRTRAGEQESLVGSNLLLILSLLAVLTVPAWVWVFNQLFGFRFGVNALPVVKRIVPSVILPLFVGLAFGHFAPRAAAHLGRVAQVFVTVALVVAVAAALYLGAPVLLGISPITVLALLVVVTGSALMGYWASKQETAAHRTVVMAAVSGNPGIALAIVAVSYPGFRATAFLAAYLILRRLALFPFEWWMKWRDGAHSRTVVAHA